MIKYSIIIPAYNASGCIDKALNSIIGQIGAESEIIIIDDGSTDDTLQKCESYKSAVDNLTVLHLNHQGVSAARNAGLDIARGEWIVFVDADDYIGEHYFDQISQYTEDIVIYNLSNFNLNYVCSDADHLNETSIKDRTQCRFFLSQNLSKMSVLSPCGKFFKREIIGAQRFTVGQKLGEDIVFVLCYLNNCSSIRISKDSVYLYYASTAFNRKYQMSAEHAKWELNNIFNAYSSLGLENPKFVSSMLEIFRKVCADDLYADSRQWYCDSNIQKIYKSCAGYLGWKGAVKYYLFRIPLAYKLMSKYLK